MPFQSVPIEFEDSDNGVWTDLDLGRLRPDNLTSWPFEGMVNRFKSSSPECEIFIHQPLTMLLETRERTADSGERDVLNRVLNGIDPTSRVSTFIVNHEETLSGYHLLAIVTSGQGGPQQLAITMWKFPPPTEEEGAVVHAAREALGQRP